MPYVWINPVTESMYEQDVLNVFLEKHGYKRFQVTGDWLTIVKQKYGLAVSQATKTVIDVRCPKTKEMLEELGITSKVFIPDVKPILIHCGQEGSQRADLQEEEKIITTPCQALADMGNALGLKGTWFVPWNKFLKSIGSEPVANIPKESPIPPGFFEELGVKTVSITGEDKIREFFQNDISDGVELVEILFCEGGCHNGDGIKGRK